MKHMLMTLALALPLCCIAQTVWRCGPDARIYSDTPCADGRRVDVPQARPDSDVDIAYAIIGQPSLFDLGGILMDFQDDLQRRVDLVDINRVKPAFREDVERDLVRA